MSASFNQQEKIFEEAVKLTDQAQRRRFLDEACASHPDLRAMVEGLLAAEVTAGKFFDKRESALSWFEKDVQFTASDPNLDEGKLLGEEQPGTCIGHYRLIQKIGEGGCGVVYLAEQEEPVRRQVALKVIKLGMDTKSVIARFATERQALASMDHPNIARVFDAGATATGRPYFVMELVRGIKITEFCDQHQLDTRRRLDLFLQICQAIQHAHQKGIIHRDIKPSNILIAQPDDVPVPKVIDFGIAKVTENRPADRTLSTAFNQLMGTPAYMSPEQADKSGLDIDTRSDIYSLGVLLYELLTGKTPFDGKRLLENGLDEMRRILREKEPQRPSTMVTTLHGSELGKIAQLRQAEPLRLVSLLKGDLDWIVLKTLEKDRQRRYETVNGLAMDIKRFLNDEPVTARPQSQLYRFQKLVKRNKIVFAAGTVVAIALITGLGAATWMFFKEREARQEAIDAEQQQTILRQEADQSRRHAEIREDVTKTAFAISQDHFEEADKNVPEISDAPPSLESAAVFRSLGEWHALNGRYDIAADRFAALSQVNQYDSWNVVTADILAQAAVLAEQGNSADYERFRESTVKQFATTSIPDVAERVIKATLLLPAKNSFFSKLEPLAKVSLPKLPQTILASPSTKMIWRDSPDNSDAVADETGEPAFSNEKIPPALVGVESLDGRSIGVDFNFPVNPTAATNLLNYIVPGTIVTNVTMGLDGNSVLLWPASELNGQFTVSARDVKTMDSNPVTFGGMATNSVQDLKLAAMGDAADTAFSASYRGGISTVVAGGSDTWKTGDNVVFQYLTVTNDFDYRLRIMSLSGGGDPFTRCCLMARDSLSDIYGHMVFVCRNSGPNAGNTNSDSAQANVRLTVGARVVSQPANPLPSFYGSNSWVRLQRSQNIFTSYYSSNGLNWVQLYQFDGAASGDHTFTNRELYLGIATCAHSLTQPVTAVTANFGVAPHAPVKFIRQPPANVAWHQGAPASLSIVLAGDAISYQWQANGLDIPGATNATLSVPAARLSDAATYSVRAYNDINSITSRRIAVVVLKDTSPPILNNVTCYDGLSIGLNYNKLVDPASATNPENYKVDGNAVTSATLMPDGQSVALHPDNPISGKFVVTVTNVQDLSLNTIAGGSKITGSVLALKLVTMGDAALRPCAVSYVGDVSATSAGGSDIGGSNDHFVYQYLVVTNDFDFRLRIKSVDGGGGNFARTGLMARDSVTDNSSHQIMVAVNADDTFQVRTRTVAGANMTQSQPPNPLPPAFGSNSWVRLQRIGTIFYTYGSGDGENWVQLYQFDSTADADGRPFANPIYLGIASCAWSSKTNVTTVVSDLGINRTVPVSTMISLALLEYRQGDYTRATEWCRLCLASDYQAAQIATAHVILAMCSQRLHHLAEARSELAVGRDIVDVKFSTGLDHGNSTQGYWFDWISARILMREAAASIE